MYASFWRRAWAFTIDILVIQALVPAAHAVQTRIAPSQGVVKAMTTDPNVPAWVGTIVKETAKPNGHVSFSVGNDSLLWLAMFVYAVVLVALVGQTFGMMISDLRVVGTNHSARVGLWRALARYLSLVASLFAVVGWFTIFRRVQPFEKWSRTRLVSGSAPLRP